MKQATVEVIYCVREGSKWHKINGTRYFMIQVRGYLIDPEFPTIVLHRSIKYTGDEPIGFHRTDWQVSETRTGMSAGYAIHPEMTRAKAIKQLLRELRARGPKHIEEVVERTLKARERYPLVAPVIFSINLRGEVTSCYSDAVDNA